MGARGPATEPPDAPAPGAASERGRRLGGWRLLARGAAIVAVLVIAVGPFVLTRGDDGPKPPTRAEVRGIADTAAKEALAAQDTKPPRAALVYARILPSLVRIETSEPGRGKPATKLGAGVIVNRAGLVLTAFHVIDGAKTITVSFADGSSSPAAVVSRDPANDIAVIAPERGPSVIVPAVLGGSPSIGDDTYAVGHPLGYEGSLSAGVVSGVDRTLETEDGRRLKGLIQFDAAVNPGSSGGPLLDRAGQVVGIVTALANPGRDGLFSGIGFAVPIETAGGGVNAPPK
ncbi:MAG: trypsin-like peptidase domain-containing protein [Gaiellales bacterium]